MQQVATLEISLEQHYFENPARVIFEFASFATTFKICRRSFLTSLLVVRAK